MKKWLTSLIGLIGLLTILYGAGTNLLIRSAVGNDQYCLDASLDHREADGDPVYVFRCHGRENQRWTISQGTNGQSLILGLGGYCLDVRDEHSRANGTPVQLWKCHYGSNQRFNILPNGQIKEVESQKCLQALSEGDRAPVVLDTCLDKPLEHWNIVRQ